MALVDTNPDLTKHCQRCFQVYPRLVHAALLGVQVAQVAEHGALGPVVSDLAMQRQRVIVVCACLG